MNAIVAGDMVRFSSMLRHRDLSPNVTDKDGWTALSFAAWNNRSDMVERLLVVEGIACNKAICDGSTPLFIAAERGHVAFVEALLKKEGIDCNKARDDSITPLYIAAQNGHVAVVEALLKKEGIDCNKAMSIKWNPLDKATYDNNLPIVRALLTRTDLNLTGGGLDSTPLSAAITKNHTAIAIADLLRAEAASRERADPNELDFQGVTRLMRAIDCKDAKTISTLLSKPDLNPNIADRDGCTALYCAARANDEATVRTLLSRTDIRHNQQTTLGATPLFIAAQKGHAKAVAALADHRQTNLNLGLHRTGATPLFVAATNGNIKIIETLLCCPEVKLNTRTKDGTTALYMAARNGHIEVVEALAGRDDLDLHAGFNDESPLAVATRNRHTDVAAILRRKINARDPNCPNNVDAHGSTMLMNAIDNGTTARIKTMLLDPELIPDLRDGEGCTALHHAVRMGDMETVHALLAFDAMDAEAISTAGATALHTAAEQGNLHATNALLPWLDFGVNHALHESGETALCIAARNGNQGIVKALLAHPDIDPNRATCTGATPLVLAASNGHADVVRELIAVPRVDLEKTSAGENAASTARRRGHRAIANMLHNAQSMAALSTDRPLPFVGRPADIMAISTSIKATQAVAAWRMQGVSDVALQGLASDLNAYLNGVQVDVRRDGELGMMTSTLFNKRYARFFEPAIAIEGTEAARKNAGWLLIELRKV